MTSTDPATQRAALENTALAARHDRQWALRVVAVWQLRPRMRRIQLTGADLGDFKPNPGQELIVLIPAPAGETLRRHYAIRRYEPASRLIDSDVLAYAFIQIGDPREFRFPQRCLRARELRDDVTSSNQFGVVGERAGPPLLHPRLDLVGHSPEIFDFPVHREAHRDGGLHRPRLGGRYDPVEATHRRGDPTGQRHAGRREVDPERVAPTVPSMFEETHREGCSRTETQSL